MKYLFEEELNNPRKFQGERVLLVDDNAVNLKVMKGILEDQGIQAETALSGIEALEKLRQKDPFFYQMIFLDINMYHMNGYETAKNIRNMGRPDSHEIPIYAVSANMSQDHRAKDAGMNGYITKPMVYYQLFALMHDTFDRQKTQGWQGERS